MKDQIKAIFEKKRYLLLFLLFILGVYAFMQSVLTRGEVQYVAQNIDMPVINEFIADEELDSTQAYVLGDRVVTSDDVFVEKPQKLAKNIDKAKVSILTDTNEAPKIVLGYKEGFNEAWDICDNVSLADSFGFNTDNCQTESVTVVNNPIAYNNFAGSSGSASSSGASSGDASVGPVDNAGETVIPEEENNETEEVILNSEAQIVSWIIGGQEVMGMVGDEPSSFTQLSVRPGILAEVDSPYHFQGVSIKTTEPVHQIVVYVYNDNHVWVTWELNYPGAIDSLANLVLTDDDVVVVKVVSEDLATTNWYKAKLFDGAYTPAQTPDFLKIFRVDGQDVLSLTGLEVDYRNINTVDFGANLLIDGFEDAVGAEVLVDDWSNFSRAKVYIYTDHWTTWDLLYPGALENLAQTALTANSILILDLEDTNGNNFLYRVNLIQGQMVKEPTENQIDVQTEVSALNSDSTLKDLFIGDRSIDLSAAMIGSAWTPSSTGAVLTIDDFTDFSGVVPQASDSTSTIKVRIFRGYWITWEYEIGLDLVAKEPILANDRVLIEVTAADSSKTYYQVQVILDTQVENPPVPTGTSSVSADEAIKADPVEELEIVSTDDDNSDLKPEAVEKAEVITEKVEISTDDKVNIE